MTQRSRHVIHSRTGFALIDVIFAALVFSMGVLTTSGLLLHSARIARSASEHRTASERVEEVADSLAWVLGATSGRRSYRDGRVTWQSSSGRVHLQAWGADTATANPILELWVAP